MKVGSTIRALRNNLDLSAAKMSRRADIHVNSLYKIEENETSPTLCMLGKIADALNVEPWHVLRAAEDEEFFEVIADTSYTEEEFKKEQERDEEREKYYARD